MLVKRIVRSSFQMIREIYRRAVGMRLYNDTYKLHFAASSSSDEYVYSEIFGKEDSYRRDVLAPIMQGGTVIDIGAHKGFFTIFAGSLAECVIAFEPDADNYLYLCRNIKLNKICPVIAVRKGVSDIQGKRSFTVSKVRPTRHTFYPSEISGTGRKILVDCTTLPALLREHSIDRVSLLKMDCEGSEYDILFNCDQVVLEKIDAIAMEIHEVEGIPHKKTELVQFLERFGFAAHIYNERVLGPMNLWMAFFSKLHNADSTQQL